MELEIRLEDTPVGVLRRSSNRGDATRFRFYDSYRKLPVRPVLGQVYEDYLEEEWGATQRLPPFFSNLLPEGVMRSYLAEKVGVHTDRELYLLAHLGQDLPGAVRVRPLTELDAPEAAPVAPGRDAADLATQLRFSLAGLQLKFSMRREDDTLTLPMNGMGGQWIVKLPDPTYRRVPETEYATMSWARAIGIEVPEFMLVDVQQLSGIPDAFLRGSERTCYAVRRFDRPTAERRAHMEDFAQVFGVYGERKYDEKNFESIGNVVYRLAGTSQLREYVRRLVFMIVSGNGDAHLKNWSLLYTDPSSPRLSPAYDLVATVPYMGPTEAMALKLAGNKQFAAVTIAAFERMASKLGIERTAMTAWVQEDVTACFEALTPELAQRFPAEVRAGVEQHLRRLRGSPGSIARLA